jgi:hypothetical protein
VTDRDQQQNQGQQNQQNQGNNKTPAVPPKAVELTIYARFNDPWSSEKAEVQAMRGGRWEPSNSTFNAVARVHTNSPSVCEDFDTFAGPILKQSAGSIARVNLITHSNPGLFALAGRFEVTPTSTTVYLGELTQGETPGSGLTSRRLDQNLINWLNDPAGGQPYRDMIRARWRPDAQFWIYGCHGGAGQGMLLLIEIAKALHVNTYSFHSPIQYDPLYTPKDPTAGVQDRVVNRKRTYYNATPAQAQEGFKHLQADAVASKPGTPTP